MEKYMNRLETLSSHLLTSNEVSSSTENETITFVKPLPKSKKEHDISIESDGSFTREKLFEEELDISGEINTQTNKFEIKTVPYTLSFDQGFFHAIRAIELLSEQDPKRIIILGIAGPVGAGKSTLANKIGSLVNGQIIQLQDFVKLENVKDNNYDDPVLIDFDKVILCLNELKENKYTKIPKIVNRKMEEREISIKDSKVIILEGSYALSARLRPLLDISIAITGGVHLDLIKSIMRGIVTSKNSSKEVLAQITNVVFPMFKAFVEADLDQAKIKIHSSFNPMSQVVEPTYVCKAKYENNKVHFDQFLSSLNVQPVKKNFSDMYLYPPKYGADGISQADKRNWIRIRRSDVGQFNIYFYNEIMDGAVNTRPLLNFEISVKTIGGLLSLGYQIGAILNRTVEVWYEKSGIVVTKEYIKELEKHFIQIKGQSRREVLDLAEKLKITGNHIPQTFLYLYFKKLKKNKNPNNSKLKPNNTNSKILKLKNKDNNNNNNDNKK